MADINEIIDRIKHEKDFFAKAKLIRFLQKEQQVPLREISQKIGLMPSYVSHILRLAKLPELIVDGYSSQLISISHLFIIARLKSEQDMIEIYEKALGVNLTTLEIENLVREKLYGIKNQGEYLGQDERDDLLGKVQEASGATAQVVQTRIKGKIVLEIKGNLIDTTQALRRLLNLLAGRSVDSSRPQESL